MPFTGSRLGFPFDEEEGSDTAWNDLTTRHPDIAARLRNRPGWSSKRRPANSADFPAGGFGNRFPFDDIPPEFRDHFPSHWSQRFAQPQAAARQPSPPPPPPTAHHHQNYPHYEHQYSQPPPAQKPPQKVTIATQTSIDDLEAANKENPSPTLHQDPPLTKENLQPHQQIPQHGLRNTVDLGQKTPVDPSVDADRSTRAMSAPPDNRQPEDQGNVRHIPIFVEGRDEPIINKGVDQGTNFAGAEHRSPRYSPSPDREQYFEREGPTAFRHPPHFSRAFGTPFKHSTGQPFAQQKVFPQGSYKQERGRSQSPKQQSPKTQQQQSHPQNNAQQSHPQQHEPQAAPQPQAKSPTPPNANDPITKILSIQKEVLDLMNEVENFVGTKKDKKYLYLDEMLTRNLIKLDDIDTDGKENIRQARREAIKCIQKCISVLEAKADGRTQVSQTSNDEQANVPPADVEMQHEGTDPKPTDQSDPNKQEVGSGDVNLETKDEVQKNVEPQQASKKENQEENELVDEKSKKSVKEKIEAMNNVGANPETKTTGKKVIKKGLGKKRDKSKDKKEEPTNNMQVDENTDANGPPQQPMEIDKSPAPAQSPSQ